MELINKIEQESLKSDLPQIAPGDTVRVHQLIREGKKERIQVFEGVTIGRQGSGAKENFTVRKMSGDIGVERTFPLHSPRIAKIEIKQKGDVRRAKLFYLRERRGKAARIKEAARKA